MGTPLFIIISTGSSTLLVIVLSYRAILGMGAQSITADRNTRRSNGSNEYKAV